MQHFFSTRVLKNQQNFHLSKSRMASSTAVSPAPAPPSFVLKSLSIQPQYFKDPKLKLYPVIISKQKEINYVFNGPKRACLTTNFKKRLWNETTVERWDWNLLWYSLSLNGLFKFVPIERLKYNQFINHFPRHSELTHKDKLISNFKAYKTKKLQSKPSLAQELDFIPETYVLPKEKNLLEQSFKNSRLWIVKPSCRARGNGIMVFDNFDKIQEFIRENTESKRFVVSKYIDNPLLLEGRKFDMRIYVLVRSFQPLIAYKYEEGFTRLCSSPYSTENLTDLKAHLTNIAIQKQFGDVGESKVLLSDLETILESEFGKRVTTQLWKQVDKIICHSLASCQHLIEWNPQCFELFGYDILVDQHLKPWLMEVNASPSLYSTSKTDLHLKTALINDVLNIVIPGKLEKPTEEPYGIERSSKLGSFKLLVDETKKKKRKISKKEKIMK